MLGHFLSVELQAVVRPPGRGHWQYIPEPDRNRSKTNYHLSHGRRTEVQPPCCDVWCPSPSSMEASRVGLVMENFHLQNRLAQLLPGAGPFTPSLVMRGAPNDLSSTTLRPLGPSVTRTAASSACRRGITPPHSRSGTDLLRCCTRKWPFVRISG